MCTILRHVSLNVIILCSGEKVPLFSVHACIRQSQLEEGASQCNVSVTVCMHNYTQ